MGYLFWQVVIASLEEDIATRAIVPGKKIQPGEEPSVAPAFIQQFPHHQLSRIVDGNSANFMVGLELANNLGVCCDSTGVKTKSQDF